MTAVMSVAGFVAMCPRRVLELLQLEGQAGQEVKALSGLLHITDQVKLVGEMEKALRLLPGAAQIGLKALFKTPFMTETNEELYLGVESLRVISSADNTTGITTGTINGTNPMPKANTTKHKVLIKAAAKYYAYIAMPELLGGAVNAVGLFGMPVSSAASMRFAKGEQTVFVFKSHSGGRKNKAGSGAEQPPLKRRNSNSYKSISGNQGCIRALFVCAGLAYLKSTDPQTQKVQDYKGVWDRAIMEEAAKRCAIANGDMNEIGHVSAEMLARYMQSIKNWKNNNQWLNTYKAHFVEMRERGITFEAAQAHLKAGNVTWYLEEEQG